MCFSMSVGGDIASTRAVGQGQKGGRNGVGAGHTWTECPTELLSEWEFQEHFRIPNNISIL